MTVAAVFLILLVAFVGALVWQQLKWRRACRQGAASIYRNLSTMYAGEHHYKAVSPDEFPALDRSGYEHVRAFLLQRGFRHLGSFENLTASAVFPEQRTFIDSYVSPTGIGASTYRIQGRQPVDFVAALQDGRYLVTTNADLDTLTPPPVVMKRTLPASMPLEELLARHTERLVVLRAQEPGVGFVTPATIDDSIAVSQSHSRIVAGYRQSIGLLTEQEMLGFATRLEQEQTARRVWREFRALVARNEGEAAGGQTRRAQP